MYAPGYTLLVCRAAGLWPPTRAVVFYPCYNIVALVFKVVTLL